MVKIWPKKTRLLAFTALMMFGVVALSSCGGAPAQRGWSGVAIQGSELYLASRDSRVMSLNASDGSRDWVASIDTNRVRSGLGCSSGPVIVNVYGTPAVSDNQMYVGGYNGKVYSFVPGDTQPDRTLDVVRANGKDIFLGQIVGSVVLADGNLYFGDSNGRVYGVNSRLQPVWAEPFKTEGKIWSSPTVSQGTVYIGSFDKKLYALDAATGAKKWEFLAGGAIISSPVIGGDTAYFGSFDRSFYAVDASSGNLKWVFEANHGFWAAPLVVGGDVYAPSLDGKVYVFNGTSGQKIAEIDLKDPISSSPVLVGNDVVVATEQSPGTGSEKAGSIVYAINTSSHQSRQIARLPGDKVLGPLSGSQGTVYVHTDRDFVFGIDIAKGSVRTFAIR
jgi:eukaryotic-like serine/threonine-protein kinase